MAKQLEAPAAGDRLYSVAEVAAMWNMSRDTIERHLRAGELVGIRLGPRRLRIPASELDRFLSTRS